jgi:PEGA domain-containing protein
VVSIDDLPQKGAKAHVGKLTVESMPLACTVAVDGKVRGTTPVLGMDVPAGSHLVRCETTSGVVKTSTVSVVEGQTARAHFSTNP